MIEISQKEFESKIKDIINGKLTRNQLTKDLQTDTRTLNNKIQELSAYNNDLYISFIEKYPYRAKERDDIDYEALIIEIIKTSMTTAQAAYKYDIGERTIRRKVNSIKKENPYLIEIYREVKKNNKNNIPPSKELEEKIEKLILRTVKIKEINETRREELEKLESTFNYRCQFVSKEQAAQSMGLSSNRMYKLLNELYRMGIEKNNMDFKESLKVDKESMKSMQNDNKPKNAIIEKRIGEK